MTDVVVVDHTRGLCGVPDLPNLNMPSEVFQANPPRCLCCGSAMEIQELSESLDRLGMYQAYCPTCTKVKENKCDGCHTEIEDGHHYIKLKIGLGMRSDAAADLFDPMVDTVVRGVVHRRSSCLMAWFAQYES